MNFIFWFMSLAVAGNLDRESPLAELDLGDHLEVHRTSEIRMPSEHFWGVRNSPFFPPHHCTITPKPIFPNSLEEPWDGRLAISSVTTWQESHLFYQSHFYRYSLWSLSHPGLRFQIECEFAMKKDELPTFGDLKDVIPGDVTGQSRTFTPDR
jgi:hypothetical protein